MIKILVQFFIRTTITLALISLGTAAVYLLSGGQTRRGLSDWMVIASFITLTAGTFSGIFRVGYKGNIEEEAAVAHMGAFEHAVKEYFRAGPFAVALTMAGLLCFLVGVLVDVL
jgi:hypothetical protein